jgi:hypothetical protein
MRVDNIKLFYRFRNRTVKMAFVRYNYSAEGKWSILLTALNMYRNSYCEIVYCPL